MRRKTAAVCMHCCASVVHHTVNKTFTSGFTQSVAHPEISTRELGRTESTKSGG